MRQRATVQACHHGCIEMLAQTVERQVIRREQIGD